MLKTQHLQVLYDLSRDISYVESPASEPFGSTCSLQGNPNIFRYASTVENSSWTVDSSPQALICSVPPVLQAVPHFRSSNPPGLFNVLHLY